MERDHHVARGDSGKPFLTGRTMIMAGHFGRRMVVYPISKRHEEGRRALINWVAELKNASDQPMPLQDWNIRRAPIR